MTDRDELIYESFTALILAGGKSARMNGVDKLKLPIEGTAILERVVETVRPLFREVIVACGTTKRYEDLENVRIVTDSASDLGPLGGIRAGLEACRTDWAFVAAGDMPFLNRALILRIARAANPGVKSVIPSHGEFLEPLHAAYNRDLIPAIDRLISQRKLSVRNLSTEASALFLGISDQELKYLTNINSPEELPEAYEKK